MENNCYKCDAPCDLEICEDCLALEQFDFSDSEADDPPEEWYGAWDSYIHEEDE